jgi:hypothetical protein
LRSIPDYNYFRQRLGIWLKSNINSSLALKYYFLRSVADIRENKNFGTTGNG